MITFDYYIRKLKSPKSAIRLDACEELSVICESSPDLIYALQEATLDENKLVANAARSALKKDVHRMMAYEMGIIPTRNIKTRG